MTTGGRTKNWLYQGRQPTGDYHFFQLAWVVPDIVEAAGNWVKVFGVGPFSILPRRTMSYAYRGGVTEIELDVAVAQSGPVQIELIHQANDTAGVYSEIYPPGTGGAHHLCTITADYDGTRSHYEESGYPLISEATGNGMRVAYYDTYRDFDFIAEVVEENASFTAHLQAIAKSCARWDGVTDPLRFLCAGGYRVPGDDEVRPRS